MTGQNIVLYKNFSEEYYTKEFLQPNYGIVSYMLLYECVLAHTPIIVPIHLLSRAVGTGGFS